MGLTEYLSKSRDETVKLGARLATLLKSGDIICLFGDLGSGKTTFTKGIAEGLKIDPDRVSSPSFTLLNEYEGRLALFHLDLYRLEKLEEILAVGYEEYFYGDGVCVVEWAQRLGNLLPENHLHVHFFNKESDERLIRFSAYGERADAVLRRLNV